MSQSNYRALNREANDFHNAVKKRNDQLRASFNELYKTREKVVRLRGSETKSITDNYQKQKDALDSYGDFAMEKEREIVRVKKQAHMDAGREITSSWLGHVTEIRDVTSSVFQGSLNRLSSGFAEGLVEGTYDWKAAMKDVLKLMIQMTVKLAVMQAMFRAIGGMTTGGFGLFFHKGGHVLHHGGNIPRRFHSGSVLTKNEVPAILERGEYVVNRRAVRRPGALRSLQAINSGTATTAGATVTQKNTHFTFNISAIDTQGMEEAVYNKVIPALIEAERRGEYLPGSVG